MSHQDIASVWAVLHGCLDIDNVLCELIGRYSLHASLDAIDHPRVRTAALHHVHALKAIFDLQRTYLQSSEPSLESKSSLLQHESLLSALIHLLQVKEETFSHNSRSPDHAAHSSLIAQTLLSGLRALLLRRQSLSPHGHERLTDRFDEVWRNERLNDVDHFVVNSLCRRMILELSNSAQENVYAKPACGIAHLQDFFHGLYPVDSPENNILAAAQRTTCVALGSPDWFHNSLVLYDIAWTAVAALIQLCMNMRKRKEMHQWTLADEAVRLNDLHLILTTRFQTQDHIYNASFPRSPNGDAQWSNEQMKTLLCLGLPPICSKDQCTCLGDDRAAIQNLRLLHGGQEVLSYMSEYMSMTHYLDESSSALQQLRLALEKRTAAICTERQQIHPRQQMMAKGSGPQSLTSSGSVTTSTSDRDTLARREQQSFSYPGHDATPDTTRSPPVHEERRPSYTQYDSGLELDLKRPTLIAEDRRPSFAPTIDGITRVDTTGQTITLPMYSPPLVSAASSPQPWLDQVDRDSLPELHHANHEQVSEPQQINTDNFPEVVQTQTRPRSGPMSIASDDSGHASSRFVRSNTLDRKDKKWSLFKSGRTAVSLSSIPFAAFFASGKSLLIWNDLGAGCYDLHNAESIQFRRINAGNVRIAAGGAAKCAVVSKTGKDHMLRVFEGSCDAPIREWQIDSLPSAMAISRNDNYLAIKFSRHVQIADLRSGGFYYHKIPHLNSRSGRGNHLVTFSNDSFSFVASTRYEPEKVITYTSECTNPSRNSVVESSAPFGLVGDDGLSSLVCSDSASRAAFLATFTEKGYPVLLSLSETRPVTRALRDQNGQIGARIHRATLDAAGANLVLINHRNDIYWISDPFGHGQAARRVGSMKRPTSVKRDVEMGMPNSDEVHLFWIEKGRGTLVTMGRSGGKSKPIELTVDMELLAA